jgi:hypothetical protein
VISSPAPRTSGPARTSARTASPPLLADPRRSTDAQSAAFTSVTRVRLRHTGSLARAITGSLLSFVAWTCQESSSWCSPSRGPST